MTGPSVEQQEHTALYEAAQQANKVDCAPHLLHYRTIWDAARSYEHDALEAAERESEERRQHLVKALQRENEARAEASRLGEALRIERNHWRAMLRHYSGDETVEVTTASARSTEKRLSAALEDPPSG